MVQFRFPDARGKLENVINVVAVIARSLICINVKSVGLQEKDAAETRTLEPSRHENQKGCIVIVGRRTSSHRSTKRKKIEIAWRFV
jgi:hypothetical protein